jgi:hypothetical protein
VTRPKAVKLAFETTSMRIPLADITPLRIVTGSAKQSVKYAQIAASIEEVGVIEPPVVVRVANDDLRYRLLDGHLRIEILKARGDIDVVCLIATEDEAFTYNKRINRLATVQEHRMILKAIEKGVPEERLARALNINISSIRNKTRLLDGICPEAVTLLQDRHVPIRTFEALRKLRPMRQIEVAEIMIHMNRFSQTYAQSLVAATPIDGMVHKDKKPLHGLTSEQIARMEEESAALEREFRMVEKDYGALHLDLVLALGYLSRVLENAPAIRHLARHQPEILAEFQRIIELRQAA